MVKAVRVGPHAQCAMGKREAALYWSGISMSIAMARKLSACVCVCMCPHYVLVCVCSVFARTPCVGFCVLCACAQQSVCDTVCARALACVRICERALEIPENPSSRQSLHAHLGCGAERRALLVLRGGEAVLGPALFASPSASGRARQDYARHQPATQASVTCLPCRNAISRACIRTTLAAKWMVRAHTNPKHDAASHFQFLRIVRGAATDFTLSSSRYCSLSSLKHTN